MNKKLIYGIGGVVLVAVLAIAGIVYWNSSSNYVAKVGDQKISESEYRFFLGNVKSEMESTVQTNGEDVKTFWNSKIDGKDAKEVAKTKALEEAQKVMIQLSKAKETGVKLEKAEEDSIKKNLDDRITQMGGNTEVDKQLKQAYGITIDDYKSIIVRLNLAAKYANEEQKKIQATDADYDKAYKTVENDQTTTVRHILISTLDDKQQPLPEDKLKEAKKTAEDVLAKVKAGGDMKELAAKYSQDPGSKDNAGQYTFAKGEMVKEFEDWAFKAKPGDIGSVNTQYGIHVIKKPKFEEIKESLKGEAVYSNYIGGIEKLMKESKYTVTKNQKAFDAIEVQ